jgi:hypothetical protein
VPSGKLFAAPAARLTGAAAAAVLVVSLIAGGVRIFPLFLAPGVPLRLAPVLARGIAAVALETALLVAPPIGWALAASRLVDRGEARALFAVGVRPARILASGWPATAGVTAAAALAAALWGQEAAAPGRAFRDLLAEGRAACTSAPPPAVADVPLLGVSWVCLAGTPPLAVGPAPIGSGLIAARSVSVSDDLRSLTAGDLEVLVPRAGEPITMDTAIPEIRVHAGTASIRGLAPIGRASNLSPAARALLIAVSASALAAAAGWTALAASVKSRATAFAVGVAGPAVALLVFSALERAPSPPRAYAAVPLAGMVAILGPAFVAARRAARTLPA